jgi:hypothetical protein
MTITTFPEARYTPAETINTAPAECLKCGTEHDLEDGQQHRELDGVGILCDTCTLFCPGCGEAVHERAHKWTRVQVLQDGVTSRGNDFWHEGCEA